MMKFRIFEIKEPHRKTRYFPQYKSFLFWKNIAEHWFVETTYNHFNGFNSRVQYVENESDCYAIIEQFAKYIKEDTNSYTKAIEVKLNEYGQAEEKPIKKQPRGASYR